MTSTRKIIRKIKTHLDDAGVIATVIVVLGCTLTFIALFLNEIK